MRKLETSHDAAIRAMLERIAERFSDWTELEPADLETVGHESRDGFMPFTNGGYRVMAGCDLCTAESSGTSGAEALILDPYIESSRLDAAEAFLAEHGRDLFDAFEVRKNQEETASVWLYAYFDAAEDRHAAQADIVSKLPFWQTAEGKLREELYDFERECLCEGSEFWYTATALYFAADNHRNKSGEDEVYIFAGINTDFTYGRDKGLESTYEINVPLSELTAEKLAEIEVALLASFHETAPTSLEAA